MDRIPDEEKTLLSDAQSEVGIVVNVLNEARKNYEAYQHIRNQIISDDISIPKPFKPYMKRVFKVSKREKIETPEETHEWLKKHMSENNNASCTIPSVPTAHTYVDILNFLLDGRSVIKSQQKAFLRDQMIYGYFLHLLCQKYINEYICGRSESTLQTILTEQISISVSYANHLRWIGKLGQRYKKLQCISLSLYELIKKQRLITNLFKNHPTLANEWL